MLLGTRVVRGPDWIWGDQDGGEGSLGTIVQAKDTTTTTLPEKTVFVYWDVGKQANYRTGYDGSFDLKVFDSAQAGVVFYTYTCDGCKQTPIVGTRWHCSECGDYDLCSTCYMKNVDSMDHDFERFHMKNDRTNGVHVGKRSGATRIQSKGLFPDAKVVRGRDWEWNKQDGGVGREGKVVDLTSWKDTPRTAVRVMWNPFKKDLYRVGFQGKVDIRCTTAGNGPQYYRDHLPNVGEVCRARQECTGSAQFKEGDKVAIHLDMDTLKAMAKGHGGWVPAMEKAIGKVGRVVKVDDDGDVHVNFGLLSWVFHPESICKIIGAPPSSGFKKRGRPSLVSTKVNRYKNRKIWRLEHPSIYLRKPVFETWSSYAHANKMRVRDDIGSKGKGKRYRPAVNALLAASTPIKKTATLVSPSSSGNGRESEVDITGVSLHYVLVAKPDYTDSESDAAESQSYVGSVPELRPGDKVRVVDNKEIVMKLQDGHGGWEETMEQALGKEGTVIEVDEDGDAVASVGQNVWLFSAAALTLETPEEERGPPGQKRKGELDFKHELLMGAFLEALLEVGGVGGSGDSGDKLVQAASLGDLQKVKEIVEEDPSKVNHKAKSKTALHVACHQGRPDVVGYLLEKGADKELKDEQDYTALHHAAYGNKTAECVVLMLSANSNVNATSARSGSTPLHLAVNQDNEAAVSALIQSQHCDVNCADASGDTPLHDAISQGKDLIVSVIVQNAAALDPAVCNKKGLNPLHHACFKGNAHAAAKLIEKFPGLVDMVKEDGFGPLHLAVVNNRGEIARALLLSGHCTINLRNKNGQTALALAVHEGYAKMIELLVEHGVNVNAEDTDGDTPLHAAIVKQTISSTGLFAVLGLDDERHRNVPMQSAIALYLVIHGADINYTNHAGTTPLDLCQDEKVTTLLRQNSKPPRSPQFQPSVFTCPAPSLHRNMALPPPARSGSTKTTDSVSRPVPVSKPVSAIGSTSPRSPPGSLPGMIPAGSPTSTPTTPKSVTRRPLSEVNLGSKNEVLTYSNPSPVGRAVPPYSTHPDRPGRPHSVALSTLSSSTSPERLHTGAAASTGTRGFVLPSPPSFLFGTAPPQINTEMYSPSQPVSSAGGTLPTPTPFTPPPPPQVNTRVPITPFTGAAPKLPPTSTPFTPPPPPQVNTRVPITPFTGAAPKLPPTSTPFTPPPPPQVNTRVPITPFTGAAPTLPPTSTPFTPPPPPQVNTRVPHTLPPKSLPTHPTMEKPTPSKSPAPRPPSTTVPPPQSVSTEHPCPPSVPVPSVVSFRAKQLSGSTQPAAVLNLEMRLSPQLPPPIPPKPAARKTKTQPGGSGTNQEPRPRVSRIAKMFGGAVDGACARVNGRVPQDVNRASAEDVCVICCDELAVVIFEPCAHKVTCIGCSVRMKRCYKCNTLIEKKISEGFKETSPALTNERVYAEKYKQLEKEFKEMKLVTECPICMDKPSDVVFLCGHRTCAECSEKLHICHVCRKVIQNRIQMYP